MLGIVDHLWIITETASFMCLQQKHIAHLDHSICFHNTASYTTFTPEQHATEVYKELFESVQKLSKPAKKKLLKRIAKGIGNNCKSADFRGLRQVQRVNRLSM